MAYPELGTTGRDYAGEKLLEDLQELVPALLDRAGEAEESGRIPEETIDDLKRIDAFKAVVPSAYGGLEADYPVIPQIFRVLGRGCTSTAWCMGFLIFHNFQFGFFPKEAQEEVWSGKGYTMAPGQVMPSGEAIPEDGGYRLSGRWGYATGILHGDWMLLSAPVKLDEGNVDVRRFYLPVEDVNLLDTWHVSAMKATGSHDVTLEDVFVPAYRSVPAGAMRDGTAEGLKHMNGPLWKMPLLTYMIFGGVAPMIGAAETLFEMVSEILSTKVGAYSGEKQAGLTTQRVRMARLRMELEATIGLWEDRMAFAWNTVVEDGSLTREQRAEMRMVIVHVARKCTEIVNELTVVAGSRGTFMASPIQRFHRDVTSLATHAVHDFDHVANLFGGRFLGVDLPENAMI